ncbi:MAG: SIS domain-containing protein [Chloroflexi bacterium]|nr:MAG: SIS domain-containing protein [Chloroflexota bacterium]
MERPATLATDLEDHISEVRSVLGRIPIDAIERVVGIILDAYANGGHVYVVGNGGSATNATHFACDLSKATIVEGRARLRVTSLADNIALLTAWANDTSYEKVFSEQLTNLLPNVVSAIRAARLMGAATVGLVGFGGGRVLDGVDAAVHVPSHDYGVVEDCHSVLEHAITASTRKALLA